MSRILRRFFQRRQIQFTRMLRQRHAQQFMFRHDRLALEDMGDGVIQGLVFRFKPADLPDGLNRRGEFLQRLQFIGLQLCQLLLANLGGRDALDLFRPALMHRQGDGIIRQFAPQLLFQFPDHRVTLLGAFGKSFQHRIAHALDFKAVFRRTNAVADLPEPASPVHCDKPPCRNESRHTCRPPAMPSSAFPFHQRWR